MADRLVAVEVPGRKGQIPIMTGTESMGVIDAGTNGQVLTANSSSPTGVAWTDSGVDKAVADAKAYTDAAIAAAKLGGGDMTVATIQAMIQDELDAGDYSGPAGRSITSFGSQDPVTGVVPVYFSDGSTVQLTLPVGGGTVDEATLTQAIEDALADGDYAGPPGRGVSSFGPPDESGVVIVYYDDGSSGELQLPAGVGSVDEAALLAAYETAMG